MYGAEVSSAADTLQPELQIWHQTGPDTYTKIGFSSVTANATASPNVHEYYPKIILQFQQGDVLGVYYTSRNASETDIYVQRENGPSSFRTDNLMVYSSALNISDLREDSNDFPLVSVVISKHF